MVTFIRINGRRYIREVDFERVCPSAERPYWKIQVISNVKTRKMY